MNRQATRFLRLLFGVAAIAAVFLVAPVSGQNEKESFTGFAINMNGGGGTATVDFTIQRWSTDAERESLLKIIRENKNPTDKLLSALQKLPKVGWIRTTNSVSWDLHYARQNPLDEGGRQIVVGTDRKIGFAEASNSGRSMDYPFTIVEFHLNKDDEGQGKIMVATKIYVDKKNNIVLENWGQEPVRFNEIKKMK